MGELSGEVVVGAGVGACVGIYKFHVTQVAEDWFYSVYKIGEDDHDSYVDRDSVGPYRSAERAYKDAIEHCWFAALTHEYLWLCVCEREVRPPGHPGGCQYCFGLKKLEEK